MSALTKFKTNGFKQNKKKSQGENKYKIMQCNKIQYKNTINYNAV